MSGWREAVMRDLNLVGTGLLLLPQRPTSPLLALPWRSLCACAGYNDELRLSDEVLDRVQWTLPPDQVRTPGEGERGQGAAIHDC